MRVRTLLQEAAWFVALTAAGTALILVDVKIGLPALLDLLTAKPL